MARRSDFIRSLKKDNLFVLLKCFGIDADESSSVDDLRRLAQRFVTSNNVALIDFPKIEGVDPTPFMEGTSRPPSPLLLAPPPPQGASYIPQSTELSDILKQLMLLQTASLERSQIEKKSSLREDFFKQCVRRQLVFDGKIDGSVRPFLYKLSEIGRQLEVTDKIFIEVFSELLKGDAKIWFTAFGNLHRSIESLTEAFSKAFLPPGYDALLLKEIRNRTQAETENLDSFVAKIVASNQLLTAPLDEPELVKLIVENLHPAYIPDVLKGRPRSLVDILRVGKIVDEINAAQFRYTSPNVKGNCTDVLSVNVQHSGKNNIRACSTQPSTQTRDRPCPRCKKTGHSVWRCPTLKCYGCGASGISIRNCSCRKQGNEEVPPTRQDQG